MSETSREIGAIRKAMGVACAGLLLMGLLLGALVLQSMGPTTSVAELSRADQLFIGTNVWQLRLDFTQAQWEAMEPKGGPGGFGGPGGGPGAGGPRGPGGFGGFGPSMFIAPVFLSQGDANQDAQFSQPEFLALGQKWFAAWDTNHSGRLDLDKIRNGLNTTLMGPREAGRPGFGPAGPGGRGPGGPPLQGSEGKRNGLASAMGIEFPFAKAGLQFNGVAFKDVAVRYKGNGTFMQSRGSLKRSLKLDLNRHAAGRQLAGVTKLNLHNCVTDASYMNEVLSHRLFRDAGVPAPRSAYARVYVDVPGKYTNQYLGLYSLVENLDNSFLKERFGSRKGALFKPVTRQLFEDLGDQWSAYNQSYDPKTPLSPEETQRVIAFCKLVSHAGDEEFAAGLEQYLDLDEFARFMAVTTWLGTMDSILGLGQNFLVYLHPKTRQFQFMPWDLDHSFGQFTLTGSQEQRETLSIHHPWNGENRFLERVFKAEKFKQIYLARMREFQQTIFQPERFHRQVDELGLALRAAVEEESKDKLERFDKVVAGEAVGPDFGGFGRERRDGGPGGGFAGGGNGPGFPGQGAQPPAGPSGEPRGARTGGPGGFGPPGGFGGPPGGGPPGGFGGFGSPVKPIKGFVTVRAKSVSDQLAGKTEGAVLGQGGPGGFGGPGGPGGQRGPQGMPNFGPGMFLGPIFLNAFDTDKNGEVTQTELTLTFTKWFDTWNTNQTGVLTEAQLRAGIDKDLSPFRGGPPGFGPPGGLGPAPGFGPPAGGRPPDAGQGP
jgi:spore coat protein CotH